ncbi:MAG: phosphatidylglycerophosphatase [Deltaproteobacteria bacterium]|nr:phosphatidylglycerophosphatase [Deltaproteobacteria bacterium]MBS1244201.1 phosphatidylglycerophosphatase [Deltaproteobacteria bacterium]
MRAVATGFGAGRVPVAPGTAGSLVGALLWYWSGGWGVRHFLLLGAIFLLAVPAAREEIAATRSPDPGSVVIDEIAGMVLAATGISWSVRSALLLFLLFRVFDVFKFGPAAWLDARKGAVYVVADDLAAGVYAGLAYRGIAWLTG